MRDDDIDKRGGGSQAAAILANLGAVPLDRETEGDTAQVQRSLAYMTAALESPAGKELAAARQQGAITRERFRESLFRLMDEMEAKNA